MSSYEIEMLWTCSVCKHSGNRGLKDRYCCNCGHKKDASDPERMPDDTSEAAALAGEEKRKAEAGSDWICKYCQANQNQLNKHCGNCGGDKDGTRLVSPAQAEVIGREVREDFQEAVRETERIGRELDEYSERRARASYQPTWSGDPLPDRMRRVSGWLAAGLALALIVWFLFWLFTPHVVDTKVSQLYWQHDTTIERYAIHRHEGWTPSFDAIEAVPLGMRHHHYDRVHVGSHREPYQDRYACGQDCSTSPSYTTCSSNSNGTARCTKHGGTRSCSTKYCYRTEYRTVQDYENVSRKQMWFMWKAWDWAYHRTVSRSGFTHDTTWPKESDLTAWLADGERERSSRHASYKITFTDLKDGDTYFIRPNETQFAAYDMRERFKLKVNNAGSVEVMP